METPTPVNPLGAKGIGEAGTIGATPAVQNAVVDARRPPRRPPHRHARPRPSGSGRRSTSQRRATAREGTMTVNGETTERRRRAPAAAGALPARRGRAHRRPTSAATRPRAARARCCVDGESVKSCTVLAVQADGRDGHHDRGPGRRRTNAAPGAARRSASSTGCSAASARPGMVMAAVVAAARRTPTPTEAEVRDGLEGNLCRCTGYHNIVAAVLAAAADAAPRGRGSDPRRVRLLPGRTRSRRRVALLAEHGDDAKLLAGGHSLLPLMKLRLAAPDGARRRRPAARAVATSATRATTSRSAR